jgi:hypothetical protein
MTVTVKKVVSYQFFACLLLGILGTQAHAIPIGEQIDNGTFDAPLLDDWAVVGTANIRPNGNAIDIAVGNAGFNNFFTSAFAVLGDTTGNINGAPFAGISSISQDFTLPAVQNGDPVASYDLTISFVTAFEGDDAVAVHDVFSATLNATSLFSQDSTPFPECGPAAGCANSQLVQNPFSTTISGLLPGTYTLTFALNEAAGGGTNTAAGIDTVSVTGEAIIAPVGVPEPNTLLLLGMGILAFNLCMMNGTRRRLGRFPRG